MKILIAGLAKTGTTGLLYLIVNSVGNGLKLLFEPQECPADLKTESGNVVVKVLIGSQLNVASFAHFDKKITIVRDPRDRIISVLLYSQYHANYLSDYERVCVVRECLEKKESSPSSVSIREILEVIGRVSGKPNMAGNRPKAVKAELVWLDDYVEVFPDGFLYKYEDFVSEDFAQLEKHLGVPLSGKAEVPGNFKRVNRTKTYGDWRNWFTAEDVQVYKPILAPWLKKYGYDAEDWEINAVPTIEREHCSGYFMRLVEEYREKASSKAKESVPV